MGNAQSVFASLHDIISLFLPSSILLELDNPVPKYFVIPHGIGSSGDLIGAVSFNGVDPLAIAFLDDADMVARPVSVPVEKNQTSGGWPEVSSLPLVV